jgi:hypothetical protein
MTKDFDTTNLVDICTVKVDRELPKEKRVTEYLRQIKDPYHFRCGRFVVHAHFDADGPTLEACLQGLLL